MPPRRGIRSPVVIPPVGGYAPPPGDAVHLLFKTLRTGSFDLLFSDGLARPVGPVVIPVLESYFVINTVTLVRADTGEPVEAESIQVGIGRDGPHWSWSASIPGSSRHLVARNADPVELLLTLNGAAIRLVVERRRRDRSHGSDAVMVYGNIKWTGKAQAHLDADEYRYLSPVFTYSATTHEPIDLMHVALTNFPAIDEPIRAALSARSAITHRYQELHVNETLKKLLAQLGLPDTTAEGDALAGVAALKVKADLQGTEIAALKAATGAAPDPAKFVPVATMQAMQAEVAALSARINGDDASRLIEAAITDGKLVEAQRTWATDLGKTNLAALKAYVDTAPSIAALKGMQSGGKQGDAGAGGSLSDSELAVCSAMGLSQDAYLKSKETK